MNQFWTILVSQAKTNWSLMGFGPKVALLSFLGIALAMLITFGVWSTQTDYVLLYGGLSGEDAAAMTARLKDDSIPFKYEASRGAILVPSGRADSARLALAAQGLPKNTTEGFELFDKSSFGTTEFVQRINYVRALQGTLARNIQALDSVESARVMLSMPQDEVFAREKQEAKASVQLTVRAGRKLSNEQIGAIRHLVASSVPKLEPQRVTIIDSAGRTLSRPQGENDASSLSEEQLGVQKGVENHLSQKVQSLLDQVLGQGQSVVRVTAQLNFERVERNVQKIDPESQAVIEENVRKETNTGRGSGPAGVPGVKSNSVDGSGGSADGSNILNNKTQSSTANKYHYNTTTERIIAETGAIKRLSVAVLVSPPPPTAAALKADANAPRQGRLDKDLRKLTEIVKSAVGFSAERKDVIQVEELPFIDPAIASGPADAPPSPVDLFSQHFNNALAFAAIVIMLIVFWRLFAKLSQPEVIRVETVVAAGPGQMLEQFDGPDAEPEIPMPPVKPVPVEVKQVSKQVGANPDRAVHIIRSLLK